MASTAAVMALRRGAAMVNKFLWAVQMTCIPGVLLLPSMPLAPEYTVVINVAKIAALAWVGILLWRFLKLANQFYKTFNYFMQENRFSITLSRETHPERWEEFDQIVAPERAKAAASGQG